MQVLGYVKSVGQGLFVSLAGNLDGRVKLSQLADGFVKDPAADFPIGRLVRAKVVAVSGDRYAAAALERRSCGCHHPAWRHSGGRAAQSLCGAPEASPWHAGR